MASTINFLRLLADPTRLRLLLLLEQEELSVAELQDVLGMGQSRISSHLAQLKRAGVVEDRRAGKNVYYGLTNGQKLDPQRAKVSELTRALAREMPETQRDRTGAQGGPAQTAGQSARIFRSAGGQIRSQLLSGPLLAGAGAYADRAPPAAHGRRSWRGRRDACAVARQKSAQSHRGR